MNDIDLTYRIAFGMIRSMGVDLAQKFLAVIPSEKDFFDMPDAELQAITSSRSRITEKSYRNACLEKAQHELDFIEKNGIAVTYFTDSNYPRRLLNAADSPIVLFSLGTCNLNAQHVVSIVGTRRCTEYGRHYCTALVQQLTEQLDDVVIVSGLAYGTDITAHRAAMKCDVPTVAVQACGLNKIYPAEHRNDAVEIVRRGGAIVSDYTSQDTLHRGNFVARNRIIAGLSDCTIVVESAEKGGSLITAHIAQSYDRDVFALPGRVGDEYSKGCNRLIQNNQAMLITCADDLINAMRWESKKSNKPTAELEMFPSLNAEEQKVVDIIRQAGDIHIKTLAERAGMPVYRIMSTVVELDCRGIIITLPGCRYTMA